MPPWDKPVLALAAKPGSASRARAQPAGHRALPSGSSTQSQWGGAQREWDLQTQGQRECPRVTVSLPCPCHPAPGSALGPTKGKGHAQPRRSLMRPDIALPQVQVTRREPAIAVASGSVSAKPRLLPGPWPRSPGSAAGASTHLSVSLFKQSSSRLPLTGLTPGAACLYFFHQLDLPWPTHELAPSQPHFSPAERAASPGCGSLRRCGSTGPEPRRSRSPPHQEFSVL